MDFVWRTEGEHPVITRNERGGTQISLLPPAKGFASALMEATVVRQFGGTPRHDWRTDGLTVNIVIQFAALCDKISSDRRAVVRLDRRYCAGGDDTAASGAAVAEQA
ncbi:hypothetical protein LCM4579_24515 [Ensifer sp. LCM 4579]|nr:hypothetical protein LCM4579_24515 [Ensifer sp. LCM 4579]